MKKVREVKKNSGTVYSTYPDKQSLEETHDMLVEALQGQSYIKEAFHKVNTTEVTGEALKKVSAGGKGGFASGGDARDQEKQVDVKSRVMVMSDPSQEAFDFNVACKKVVAGFGATDWDGAVGKVDINKRDLNNEEVEYEVEFKRHTNTTEYLYKGESMKYKVLDPRRASKYYVMENGKWKRKWNKDAFVELSKSHGRDYNDFAHSNSLDPSDKMKLIEVLYSQQEFLGQSYISKEDLDRSRELYDALCGYRGAWKYVGLNGAEHRRYRIVIVNTLNTPDAVKWRMGKVDGKPVYWKETNPTYNCAPSWTDEHSTSRHHKDLHLAMNKFWRDGDEEALDKWLMESNNDHAYYVMWYLGRKSGFWQPSNGYVDVPSKPANKLIKASRVLMSDEYEAKREAIEELTKHLYFDLKAVYRYEGTTKGKIKFIEPNKANRPDDWVCNDRANRNNKSRNYRKLRK